MDIRVLTLFPEQIEQNLRSSITGRALERRIYQLQCINIRDYAGNRYGKVDDKLYGGGTGMLMQCEPIYQAWLAALDGLDPEFARTQGRVRTVYLSPKGPVLREQLLPSYLGLERLILLCGHYEGVDNRVLEAMGAEELSIGDFVLSGGELAACVFLDALLRLLPGVLPSQEAYEAESHSDGLLECRQYTTPEVWRGRRVPQALRSGSHEAIHRWRRADALWETAKKRPDLFRNQVLEAEAYADLLEHIEAEQREAGQCL